MDRLKAQRDAKKADESDEPADGLVTGRLGGGAQVMPRSTPVWDEASTPGYKPGTPLTKEARGELVVLPDETAAEPDPNALVKCSEFFFKESGRKCYMCSIPDGLRLNTLKLGTLKEQWDLCDPNTLIASDAGTVHPKAFASEKLIDLPSFTQFYADAQLHAERAGVEKGADRDAFALSVVNDVIFTKLVTIFASVLDAAAINTKSPNWLIVDRVRAKSPAAELLLEAAMTQTLSRPVIIVIDSMDRLKNFRGEDGSGPLSPYTQACINRLEKVRETGIPLGTDDACGCETIYEFYKPSDFMDPNNFAELEHLRPDGTVPDRVKWQYHYLQTVYNSGTHYIMCDLAIDVPDMSCFGPFGYICANGQGLMFPRLRNLIQQGEALVMLHNTGGVTQSFASLRKSMLSSLPPPEPKELLESIETTSPAAWTKNFGLSEVHMLKELHQRAPMLLRTTVVSVDVMKDSSEEVLSTLTCCFSGTGGVPELGLGEAEVVCVLTAWKRHIILLANAKKFERFADGLQMMIYFVAVASTVCAVLFAMELADNEAAVKMIAADAELQAALALAPDGASNCSSACPGRRLSEDPNYIVEPVIAGMTWLGLSVVICPILSTAIATMKSRLRPREKWATCLMASHQIVSQIYYYRLRTDVYDTMAPMNVEEGEAELTPKQRNTAARLKFVQTVGEIYTNTISTEVAKAGSLQVGKVGRMNPHYEGQRAEFYNVVRDHTNLKLFKRSIADPNAVKAKKEKAKKREEEKAADRLKAVSEAAANAMKDLENAGASVKESMTGAAEGVMAAAGKDVEVEVDVEESHLLDDYVSQMDIETYIECRVRPLSAYFERRAPVLARRNAMCEYAHLAANTAGAVLSVLMLGAWLPPTVAVAASFLGVTDYFYIPSQLEAANRAEQEVHNLLNWWESLSLVQRKARLVKQQCAQTAEGAVLGMCSSRTGVSPVLPSQQGGESEE